MRAISSPQDPILYPLNRVLGRESQVRLLRALCELDGSAGAASLTAQVGMSLPGTLKALEKLVSTGIVVRHGSGRARQYEMATDNLLSDALAEIFAAERDRAERLVDCLRHALSSVAPPPRSVWRRPSADDPAVVELVVLHDVGAVSPYVKKLRKSLLAIEQRFDVTVEIAGVTDAEIDSTELARGTLLFGVPPRSLRFESSGSPIASHTDLDSRARARAAVLARWVNEDPTLIPRARRRVEHLLRTDRGTATAALEEWRNILQAYPPRRVGAFLKSRSSRAERLRQSSPFLAILTAEERAELEKEST